MLWFNAFQSELRECWPSSSRPRQPTVGSWHLPDSHPASLIPLIFTVQKTKVFVLMCNCEQVRSVVWEARPAAWDTLQSLAGSHSHNRWGKTSLIGLIHMEQLFIIVAISEQSTAHCLYSFKETYYLNICKTKHLLYIFRYIFTSLSRLKWINPDKMLVLVQTLTISLIDEEQQR